MNDQPATPSQESLAASGLAASRVAQLIVDTDWKVAAASAEAGSKRQAEQAGHNGVDDQERLEFHDEPQRLC